ncbi:hypothetical protein BATDEDRAFT_87236 [Batrachochytrium dendrobatidis JAM81]|uniref:Protein Lines N-terminal domain-containing protein n=1 Tax=Batrachochytrium dendrobatidis (strain JAM81 / FGSC 10211) TaxID=684364 RepID=F4NYS0_BATDJ|nr:uncharacterized protein BATDEDRAFT_87236 [Batrachochytrium dendrobatidis JAM81]EGF81755.1 hypothetical protein BATDEDRAFT_87236 [Batrachochytrium dendrobatidis JAM81]|eukprot:XP_006677516.1 hypothetical protein BATDEDRAFT_87236 [Batrachochytrium dendrobatidis JAM81]
MNIAAELHKDKLNSAGLHLLNCLCMTHRLLKCLRKQTQVPTGLLQSAAQELGLCNNLFLTALWQASNRNDEMIVFHAVVALLDVFKTCHRLECRSIILEPLWLDRCLSKAETILTTTASIALQRKTLHLLNYIAIKSMDFDSVLSGYSDRISTIIASFVLKTYSSKKDVSKWWDSIHHPSFTEFYFPKNQSLDRQSLKLIIRICISVVSSPMMLSSKELSNTFLEKMNDLLVHIYGSDYECVSDQLFKLFSDHDSDLVWLLERVLAMQVSDDYAKFRNHLKGSLNSIKGVQSVLDTCAPSAMFLKLMEMWGFDHQCLLDLVISDDTCFYNYLSEYLHFIAHNPWNLALECKAITAKIFIKDLEDGHADDDSNEPTDYYSSTISTLDDLLESINALISKKLISSNVSSLIQALCQFRVSQNQINELVDE